MSWSGNLIGLQKFSTGGIELQKSLTGGLDIYIRLSYLEFGKFIFFYRFSCYLIFGFLGSICKFFGEGGQVYIELKFLFFNIHTSIFFFVLRGGGGHGPPQPLSSSVTVNKPS